MSPDSIHLLFALAIGFAIAGLLTTGYQVATSQVLSFRLLERGPKPSTFATVPILVLAAPFIIMRNTILSHEVERPNFQLAMAATLVAGIWSLMSGTVAIMALAAVLYV